MTTESELRAKIKAEIESLKNDLIGGIDSFDAKRISRMKGMIDALDWALHQ